jgi:benzylsuccinate synthase
MTTCKECIHFFPREDNPETGDCVERVVDPRQAYHKARPVGAEKAAAECASFEKK